jgi:hypothetical protein
MKRETLTLFAAACGLALMALPATAGDTYIANSNGDVGNAPRGQNIPRRSGNYNLDAYAFDSNGGAAVDNPKGPIAYSGTTAVPAPPDSTTATATGFKFAPTATAVIHESGPGQWNSMGSSAIPGVGTDPTKGPGETYEARATIRDPWSFDLEPIDCTFTDIVTFSAGMMVQALAPTGETAQASISADGSTDLDGLGELWTFSLTTDSADPGVPTLTFWSNPALGLDDLSITAALEADISSNPATGASSLTSDFTFSFDLTVPANTQPVFSSDVVFDVNGSSPGTAPEPGTSLLLGSALIIGPTLLRRRRK